MAEKPKSTLSVEHPLIHWEASDFTQTLVSLATRGDTTALDGSKRPDVIALGSWRKFTDDLWERTQHTGKEHGRVILADIGTKRLVMGKQVSGAESTIRIPSTPQPSRAPAQRFVGSIHTHPAMQKDTISNVFSRQDYFDFLTNPQERFMAVVYGPHDALLVLKTTATPQHLTPTEVKNRIELALADMYSTGLSDTEAYIAANKIVCLEFQLVLYRRSSETDEYRRIKVAG